jgi:nucleotide-binding universal stress UspA family protein
MAVSVILVPVEYSPHCLAALEYAGALAKTFGAKLEAIHVWELPPSIPAESTITEPGGEPRSLFDLVRDKAEREMADFLARAKLPDGVAVTHHIESGDPTHAILAAIERRGADLVVISTHGRTGVRRFLLGSVAERLVRLSPVPVVTVPAKPSSS